MVDALIFVEAVFLALLALVTLAFVISSIWEREKRAASIGGVILAILLGGEIALFGLERVDFFQSIPGLLILLMGLIILVAVVLLLIQTRKNPRALQGTKGYIVGEIKRVDEREQVFARNRTLPRGSEQYGKFYSEHPRWEKRDARRREKGGPLGVPGTIDKPGEGPGVAALFASFSIPQHLGASRIVQPQAHPHFLHEERISLSPEEGTNRVKGFVLHLGADLVGITEINRLWVYSRRGEIFWDNWDDWGKEIDVSHRYAIVFAMEMSREMVWAAPHTASTVESGAIYAKGAFIATEIASFIANLGYPATANHLRHYDTLLVPLAIDAGLGELGRLGYLVTKEFGPRVRLGCVTTDLPLIPDSPVDIGVEDFCRVCKKCALCCPSNSIPFDDPQEVNGTLRWNLNAETCFDYWGRIGTDCSLCMRVCPWSHPRTLPHRLITELVVKNKIARRIFSAMDDVFYGKKPKPSSAPKWATCR